MQSLRRLLVVGRQSPNLRGETSRFFSTESASQTADVSSILRSLSLQKGDTLVQNYGNSEIGKKVIQEAKKLGIQTISIIEDKPGTPETIEELKALGGDIVVPESYTKTWYMKRLVSELKPKAGLNLSEGHLATAVAKAVEHGGAFMTFGKKLPQYVAYDGASRKAVEWNAFLKEKGQKVLN
ncbi:hypothetical protein H6P81_009780 [Aristolochia fimbriata]|uniref:Uncharacterized protein n=1 Tax=Aristolochia fimbriata TaxID=158543 RepID=A0AAV7ENX2_ARIFI|nr:hypothetical protein H6P81_009780 [Aristolochia fimbriata]